MTCFGQATTCFGVNYDMFWEKSRNVWGKLLHVSYIHFIHNCNDWVLVLLMYNTWKNGYIDVNHDGILAYISDSFPTLQTFRNNFRIVPNDFYLGQNELVLMFERDLKRGATVGLKLIQENRRVAFVWHSHMILNTLAVAVKITGRKLSQ